MAHLLQDFFAGCKGWLGPAFLRAGYRFLAGKAVILGFYPLF